MMTMHDISFSGSVYWCDALRPDILRKKIIWLPALILVLFTGIAAAADNSRSDGLHAVRSDGTLEFLDPLGNLLAAISIEIADTEQSRSTGLMWRTGLDDTMGMLFIYEYAQHLTFWMRNTPTPLDIIFISAGKKVIHIARNTLPMSDTHYFSHGAAQYVVEVPAGFCLRNKVKAQTRIRWRRKAADD
jgi:uncharacterized membrane protein (UPF0127 family)